MTNFTRQTILDSLPHRPPFLFVDEIRQWTDEKIVTSYRFKEDEFFFQGHYPDRPIVPGVILCESAMQAGAIFLSRLFHEENFAAQTAAQTAAQDADSEFRPPRKKVPVVGRLEDVRFKKIVVPGEEILCEAALREKMTHVFFMTAKITSGGQLVARFGFACTQAESD